MSTIEQRHEPRRSFATSRYADTAQMVDESGRFKGNASINNACFANAIAKELLARIEWLEAEVRELRAERPIV